MNQEHNAMMAALIFLRFNRDHEAARAAWKRLLQNDGWDATPEGRQEWVDQVERGLRILRAMGMVHPDAPPA